MSGSLAACSQPDRRWPCAASLRPRAASSVASAQEDRRMTRRGWIVATCFAVILVGRPALFRPVPQLIWNASASVPLGLYRVLPARTPHVGEVVVVRPPDALADFLAERGYLAV